MCIRDRSYGAPLLAYLYSLFYGSILLLYPNTVIFNKKVRIGIVGICVLIFIATEIIMSVSYTHLDVYKRQVIISAARQQQMAISIQNLRLKFRLGITSIQPIKICLFYSW